MPIGDAVGFGQATNGRAVMIEVDDGHTKQLREVWVAPCSVGQYPEKITCAALLPQKFGQYNHRLLLQYEYSIHAGVVPAAGGMGDHGAGGP